MALGRWGEAVAARYLAGNGFRVLRRNFRAPSGGEVDIVARDVAEGMLVFLEVKTRADDRYARPADAVDQKKEKLILRGAAYWLRLLNNPDLRFRFDIVEVVAHVPPKITLLPDAFQPPDDLLY